MKNLIFDLQTLTCFTRLYLNIINMLAESWKSLKIPKGQPESTYRATRTPLNTGVNSGDSEGEAVHAPMIPPSCFSS